MGRGVWGFMTKINTDCVLLNDSKCSPDLRSIGDDKVGGVNIVNEGSSQVDCTSTCVSHLFLGPGKNLSIMDTLRPGNIERLSSIQRLKFTSIIDAGLSFTQRFFLLFRVPFIRGSTVL